MTIPSLSQKGKVALVTGARRGIGEACALVFAEAGADVAICDWVTDTGELAEVADKIEKLGCRSLTVQADAKNKAEVEQLVQKVLAKFGAIDILVNNAGVGDGGHSTEPNEFDPEKARASIAERAAFLADSAMIVRLDEEAWDRVFDNNLKSCLLCSKIVAAIMIKQKGGNIINISSVRAYARGRGALTAYAISKQGMVMLTEGLAADLAKYNIRVNAIAPGGIETEMMRIYWAIPEHLEPLTSKMPLSNALIPPSTCAYAALFLASDAASYITGHTIVVDGGDLA